MNIKDHKEISFKVGASIDTTLNSTESIYRGTAPVNITKTPQIEKPTLYKQPRGLLKTQAKTVGRDTTELNLFATPTFESKTNPYKKTIARNTAILGNYLIKLWQQKNKDGVYTIDNLTKVAGKLGIIPQDLKTYLVYLGGYQYPVISTKDKILKSGKKQKILSISTDKLFYIKFNSRLRNGETEESFNKDLKVGTHFLSFIKNRDIDTVEVKPSDTLIDDLRGDRLGNVFTDDAFFSFASGLSDMAYKLFTFSGSNEPYKKIRLNKLIDSLGLTEQVKKQGKPRVLNTLKKALNELKTNGHIVKWEYQKSKEMFSWQQSNKIFKHKKLLPKSV